MNSAAVQLAILRARWTVALQTVERARVECWFPLAKLRAKKRAQAAERAYVQAFPTLHYQPEAMPAKPARAA